MSKCSILDLFSSIL